MEVQVQELFTTNLSLLKGGEKSVDGTKNEWKVAGIASAEGVDEDGEHLLRSTLDISYLNKRGTLNWNHYADPDYQLGVITKAVIIAEGGVAPYEELLGRDLPKDSTIFIEGELYKTLAKAQSVLKILSEEQARLGLSIEGAIIYDKNSNIEKVFARNCAITASPAQSDTLCQLAKSLSAKTKLLDRDEILLFIMERYPNFTRVDALKALAAIVVAS